MNIFVLDYDIQRCAQYHCDKHVVKMILESAQLLNNALIANSPNYNPIYRQTHKNHPASIWTGYSRENFDWLNGMSLALCDEYTYRYGKTHKCQEMLEYFQTSPHRLQVLARGLTPFVKCMPDQYKVADVVQSYRNYYLGDKVDIAKWTKRSIPEWWKN